jgi:hypothetical protein
MCCTSLGKIAAFWWHCVIGEPRQYGSICSRGGGIVVFGGNVQREVNERGRGRLEKRNKPDSSSVHGRLTVHVYARSLVRQLLICETSIEIFSDLRVVAKVGNNIFKPSRRCYSVVV